MRDGKSWKAYETGEVYIWRAKVLAQLPSNIQKSLCLQITHNKYDIGEMTQMQALHNQTVNSEFKLLSGSDFQAEVRCL